MREIPHFTADETDRGMENLNAGTNYRDSGLVHRRIPDDAYRPSGVSNMVDF